MLKKYDAIVIGAGMSGLACAIRLAMFDKKVLLMEKHSISGGLNSYYQRRNKDLGGVRKFDVGLHALTNFVKKGTKGAPLTKLLKQLRIKYDDLKLQEQSYSLIQFPDVTLKFSNDFLLLQNQVYEKFPSSIDAFNKLVNHIKDFNELDLSLGYQSSREVLKKFIQDDLLNEMLLCPLLIYGSAWERDMDFAQFVVMFKSLYFEGFSKPEGGVRTILELLLDKYEKAGGELKFRSEVQEIIIKDNKACGVKTKKGDEILADKVFSSMGLPETYKVCDESIEHEVGNMTFMETLIITDKKIDINKFDATISFYNDGQKYDYQKPSTSYDPSSAVICIPDNYDLQNREGEGLFRLTFMANYDHWSSFERSRYLEEKEKVYADGVALLKRAVPGFSDLVIRQKDVFSPTTIKKYTSHLNGTVYGSTDKSRDGKSKYENLYIIGTDQGFLGIVGSMLSGISIGNMYGLMERS